METTHIIVIVAIVLVLLLVYMKFFSGNKSGSKGIGMDWTSGSGPSENMDGSDGKWTIYGSDSCGWTLKQLAVCDNKGMAYDYINCGDPKNAGKCKGKKAFPTLVDPKGVTSVGFNACA